MLERTGTANPFLAVTHRGIYPDLIDYDGDGDVDVVHTGRSGGMALLENTGSSSVPAFVARSGADNPFKDVQLGIGGMMDIDGDGDLDFLLGAEGAPAGLLPLGGGAFLRRLRKRRHRRLDPMKNTQSLRSCVRRELGLGRPARRALRVAALAGLFGSLGAAAQPPYRQELLPGVSSLSVERGRACPRMVDLDADGQDELVVGDGYGQFQLFVNRATG